jgi:PKD repeat protein
MKHQYKFMAALALFAGSALAQQIIPCGTDQAMNDLFAKDPEAKARYEKIMNGPASQDAKYGNNATNTVYYPLDTIPIVFHILHQNGSENIPDATVYQALAEVNSIMQKQNSDTAQVDPYFANIIGRNNIVFKLATKDPNGNCTNGIIRHLDPNTDWSQTSPGYSYSGTSAGKWNPTKYLNIYVVKSICQSQPCSQSGGIIVGYTYIPGTLGSGSSADAIVYNYGFLTGVNARSLAHEIGHWLGLAHTFGSTNSPGTCTSASDDFLANGSFGSGVVDDTPKTPGAFSTCPPSTPNTCDVSNYQNVHNIMDYSSCPRNFTEGQCKRMHNCLGLTISGRNNLVTAANKIATGVRFPIICAPIADFHVTQRNACPNTTVTFSDSSANAKVTSWTWSFPGGTLMAGSTLTDSMPKVSYATPGTYPVSYTAATSGGSNSISKNNYMTVLTNTASYNTAWSESFETNPVPGTDWSVTSSPTYDWSITSAAAATGTNSLWLDNTVNTPGTMSILQSTSFDISTFALPKLTLKVAYRQQTSTDNDKFQVLTSTDCGNTWTPRFTRQGSALASVTPASTTPFVPGPTNFTTYTVNINGVFGSPNVRFRFVFSADPTGTGGVGNNIYLDDINLFDASVGINSIEEQVGLNIYPNPTSGVINLELDLSEAHSIGVEVTDVLGRAVESLPAKQFAAGMSQFALAEKRHYQPGVYFVHIEVDGKKITRKVVVH